MAAEGAGATVAGWRSGLILVDPCHPSWEIVGCSSTSCIRVLALRETSANGVSCLLLPVISTSVVVVVALKVARWTSSKVLHLRPILQI